MYKPLWQSVSLGLALCLAGGAAWAHDPVFGLGPHVLYKDGVEVHVGIDHDKAGTARDNELGLELTYGLTGDWAAGVEQPYARMTDAGNSARGFGDTALFTKYRFWRHDTLGTQETAAVLLKVKSDSGDERTSPALGTGSKDWITGLAYGYESRKWYRWAALRYRHNGVNAAGLRRGDKILFDLVGGIRPTPSGYLEADSVWMLELNGEFGRRGERNGVALANTGGTEWFVSPGLMWTHRNFALKSGVQIPVSSSLNGNQQKTDYRARLVLEWHL